MGVLPLVGALGLLFLCRKFNRLCVSGICSVYRCSIRLEIFVYMYARMYVLCMYVVFLLVQHFWKIIAIYSRPEVCILYVCILKRTFNNILCRYVRGGGGTGTRYNEVEFQMLSQNDDSDIFDDAEGDFLNDVDDQRGVEMLSRH